MEKLARSVAFGVASLFSLFWLHGAAPHAAGGQSKVAVASPSDSGALYAKQCATCHGKDGQAKTFKAKFNHARNFNDAAWQASVSDEHLFNSISQGRGKMPAFGKKLSAPDIEALIVYVRKLKK